MDLRCIATHARLPKGLHGRAALPERLIPQRPRGPDLDALRPAFDALGLEGAQARNVAHHARKILALRERFSSW